MSMLQFTFGPVQGFVAQARTTRDFWAGSYLLSYLSGSALVAALSLADSDSARLRLVIPADDDSLFRALRDEATPEQLAAASQLGTLPNRFRIDGDPEALRRAAQAASEGLQAAWRSVAQTVWDRLQRTNTRGAQITPALADQWQQQVERQWEISWVISDNPSDLDLRKNWRVFDPLQEPGVRCSQCGQRSALSPSGGGRHGDVATFWREVADRFNRGRDGYQLRPDERLCAICTIKRLYPLMPGRALRHGLKPGTHYASTATVAATDWVDEVRQRADKDPHVREAWEDVQCLAQKAGVSCPRDCRSEDRPYEYDGYLYFADKLKQQGRPLPEELGLNPSQQPGRPSEAASVPRSGLAADTEIDAPAADTEIDAPAVDLQLPDVLLLKDESKRSELVRAVSDLKEVMGHGPRPMYALLVMDGDHMGALLNRPGIDPGDVSKALSQFSTEVRRLVAQHHGRPTYAGGDDVLALLPAQPALCVAREIRRAYTRCFEPLSAKAGEPGARARAKARQNIATISAAIVYADMREPLRDVIAAGHRVLDQVAKDATGRDAFALLMRKHSGSEAVLSKKWEEHIERAQEDSAQTIDIDWVDEVCQLVQDIRSDEVSTGLLYHLRDVFRTLAPEGYLPDRMVMNDEAVRFIASEYLRNRLLPWPDDATPDSKLERALEQARRLLGIATVRRELTGRAPAPEAAAEATQPAAGDAWLINLDGPIVARFLADKERSV